MNATLRNIVAVIAGWFGGSVVNMGLVKLGHHLFPIEGLDPESMESLAAIMPTLEAKYFLFPFLAHALGTLVGAALAAKIGINRKMTVAMIVGGIFLLGGIMMSYMIKGPIWFIALDLLIAYIPMAWLGSKLAYRKT